MGEQKPSDNPAGQGKPPAGPGEGTPPGAPADGGQGDGQGDRDSWDPKTHAMFTKMSQQQAEKFGELREEVVAPMQDEIDRLRAENAGLRAPPEAASDVNQADVAVFEKIAKSSPVFQGVLDENRSLRRQVRTTAVDASLADLKSDPYFDKVAPEVKRLFHGISDESGVQVTSEMVGDTYRSRAYVLADKDNTELRAQLAEAERVKREDMGNADLGSGSDASGDSGPDFETMTDEEREAYKAEHHSPERIAEFIRTGK